MANGHGGPRPGSGRKRGSLSKKTTEVIQAAVERGITPLEVLLSAMIHYHETGDRERACAVAKDAAPYVHPRLSSMQVSGGETPVRLALVEEIVLGGHSDTGNGTADDHPDDTPAPGPGRLLPQ